jgi:hypothetical protein
MVLSLFLALNTCMRSQDIMINSKIWNHVVNWMLNLERMRIKLILTRLVPRSLLESRPES